MMPPPTNTPPTAPDAYVTPPSTKPARRVKQDHTVSPDIEMFTSERGDRHLALLHYNGARSFCWRGTRDEAYDAAFQFYLAHTAAGKAASEPVT